MPLPSQKYLRECFSYDPETGILTWRERPRRHFKTMQAYKGWNKRYAGQQAGKIKVYRVVGLDHQQHRASRLIFKLMTGRDPIVIMDHRDRNRLNDRWENLREATEAENVRNRCVRRDNALGIKGVRENPYGRFEARILINRRPIQLGTFATVEEARAAYLATARAHWRDFAGG